MKNKTISIAGKDIEAGTRVIVNLPSSTLYTQTDIGIPIHIFHGIDAGPKLFITATIHGDELNSIEILRKLKSKKALKNIKGTLFIIPVVNVFGFIIQSRYLPDRRDLNRSFPGSDTGSLAARLAHVLMEEIITKCDYGIDLHTAAYGRMNMPQLRVNLGTPGAKSLACAFEVPVILDAKIRDGSLRQACSELGIPILVYEGGEALRFNELCIRMGVRGILKVMQYLGMIDKSPKENKNKHKPIITQTSRWIRAPVGGLVQPLKHVAQTAKKGEILAYIHDPFLINTSQFIVAPFDGIIVGLTNLLLVNEGDAMVHLASNKKLKHYIAYIDELSQEITPPTST